MYDVPTVCYRCGHPTCDPRHTFWGCPFNSQVIAGTPAESTDAYLTASQDTTLDCFWLRGILPAHLVTPKHPVPHAVDVTHRGHVPTQWPSGTYYTDGSGGAYSSYSTLRRCGFGVAYCDPHFEFGIHSPLPGIQTVPRAELWAVLYVALQCTHRAHIHIITDSENTMRGIRTGRRTGDNADLWIALWKQVADKCITLQVDWVKSHLDKVDCEQDFPQAWIYGNACADVLAEYAAADAAVPQDEADTAIRWYTLLPKVQHRLALILQHVASTETITHGPPICDVDITGEAPLVDNRRKHSIAHDEEGAYCTACSHRQGLIPYEDWIHIRCMGVPRSGSPIRGPARPIHLTTHTVAMCGQVVLHPSHTLWYYRGQFWCMACGRTAGVSGRS